MTDINDLLSIPAAALVAGVTRARIWKLIADGKLTTYTVSDKKFLLRADIEAREWNTKNGRPPKSSAQ